MTEETRGDISDKTRQGLTIIAVEAIQLAQRANGVAGEPIDAAKVGKALDKIEARLQETRRELAGKA